MSKLISDLIKSTIQKISQSKSQQEKAKQNQKQKQKKVIQKWDFIMVFQISAKEQLNKYFMQIECLKQNNVKYTFIDHKQDQRLLILLSMNQQIVIQQAHQLKILKIKDKKSFKIPLSQLNQRILTADLSNSKHYADYLRFIKARYKQSNKRILEQQKYSIFNKYKKQKYPLNQKGKLFTQQEQLRCKYNYLLTYNESVKKQQDSIQDSYRYPFVDIMKHNNFIDLVPIHKNSQYKPIICESIKDYIGSNQQVYFEFVQFLQKWLMFPAFIGLLTTFFNYFFQWTADDSPGDFLYSFLIIFWSIYFITNWQNQSKWLKIKQSSGYNDQLWSQHQNIIVKDGLKQRISNITGKVQYYLPFKEKIYFYFISIGTCVLISLGSIVFMIISLNARGFVDPDHKLLYFETVSSWAATGGIFDANTWWGQIPNLVHVLVTNVFDEQFYRPLAKKLTLLQKHLNRKTHSNSIIIKYFVYEFIITFADFFYIAFVRFDIEGLREQLLSLFFIDIIRRLVAETLLPLIKNKYFSSTLKGKQSHKQINQDKQLRHEAIIQVNKQHFQSFDDYLQIITNFSYLVLISSVNYLFYSLLLQCFPLAPVLIIFAHSIQIFQDKYKLIHIYRRKLPQKFVGMGYWKDIIVFICYMSILTNILLFAFSSKQIVSIFPQIFQSGKDLVLGNTDFTSVMGDAATSVLSAIVTLGNSTLETITMPLDYLVSSDNSTQFNISNLTLNEHNCTNNIDNYLFNDTPMMSLTSYQPVPKQHQIQFIGILFLLQHVFLIGFILLRKILSKRKNISDIFLQRRAYKRNIKKYLSKDILSQNLRDQIVNKLILNMGSSSQVQNSFKKEEIQSKNNQNLLQKLLSLSTASTNNESIIKQNDQTQDIFSSIVSKIVQKTESFIDRKSKKQVQQQSNLRNSLFKMTQSKIIKHQ